MKKKYNLLFIALFTFITVMGQNNDSVFYLNIERIYKLKVLETYDPSAIIPQIQIAYPYSAYDSVTKSLRILDIYPDCYRTTDTTKAIIRVSKRIDKSFGDGETDDLIQFYNTSEVIDPQITADSVSFNGTFYLKIKDSPMVFKPSDSYSFDYGRIYKEKGLKYESIIEYSVKNYGTIRRYVDCEIGH